MTKTTYIQLPIIMILALTIFFACSTPDPTEEKPVYGDELITNNSFDTALNPVTDWTEINQTGAGGIYANVDASIDTTIDSPFSNSPNVLKVTINSISNNYNAGPEISIMQMVDLTTDATYKLSFTAITKAASWIDDPRSIGNIAIYTGTDNSDLTDDDHATYTNLSHPKWQTYSLSTTKKTYTKIFTIPSGTKLLSRQYITLEFGQASPTIGYHYPLYIYIDEISLKKQIN